MTKIITPPGRCVHIYIYIYIYICICIVFAPVLILFLPNLQKVREKGETKSAIDHVFFCGEGLEPMKRSSCALDRLELSDCLLPGPVLRLSNCIARIREINGYYCLPILFKAYPSDHIALAVKFEIKPFGKKHSDTCSSTT